MSLTVELPPDVEARFRTEAEARGVSLPVFVADWLAHHAPAETQRVLEPAGAERLLDELAHSLPDMPALSDEALRRENLYAEDER